MVTTICIQCGKEIQVKPHRIKNGKKVCCSKKCYGEKLRKNPIKRICPVCSLEFFVQKSRIKYGRGICCSKKCQNKHVSKKQKRKRIKTNCMNCNKEMLVTKLRYNSHKNLFCCQQCKNDYFVGENHYMYINGDGINWHGPNWYSQRRKALKRDSYQCQDCGITKEESETKFGQSLTVHHKIPFRKFDGNYKKANRLSNLITLCHKCHREAEWEIQKNETLRSGE